jgi:hypothetical protein
LSVLVLYGLVIFMAFLVNPFLFFYSEEREEQGDKISRVSGNKNNFIFEKIFFVENMCSIKMDSWIFDISYYFDNTWVKNLFF